MRVPERALLLLALAGGSPAALLGMRLFHHKTSKESFKVKFWFVILVQASPGGNLFALEAKMIQLFNKRTGEPIGPLNEAQLKFLVDQLEEESLEDKDYAITSMTLDYFEEVGGDAELIKMLRGALGSKDEIVIVWME